MAEKQEFWTEARLKKGIIWVVGGILVVILATAGWWYYLNKPEGATPPVLQRAITDALAREKKTPSAIGPHIELAQLYIQNKQYDDGIVECDLILKIQKDNEFGLSLKGIAYDLKGNQTAAISYYQKTIALASKRGMSALNPAIVESRFRLAKIYLDQKKYDAALVQFQTLADQNAMDADSRYYLGLTFYKKGAYDKAIDWELQATRYVPDYYDAFFVLGQAYEKKGDKAKAIAAYKSALKGKADFKEAKDALARLGG
jgi:tetratricopeptide (TPR) repeat protein